MNRTIYFVIYSIWIFLFPSVLGSKIRIQQVPSLRSLCGEGPHWDTATQSLYYIDVYGPEATILRYDFNENKTYAATVDKEPLMTFVLPVEGTRDQFLVGTKDAAKIISWDGKSKKGSLVRTAFQVESGKFYETNRFNDAKADPVGRFFGGTMRLSECDGPFNVANGSVYRYDHKHGVKRIVENVLISNGLTWNPKANKMYYIDSCTHDIKQFHYDIKTGKISKESIVFELKESGKTPDYILDGMTIDIEGNLFAATMGGNKVLKIDPLTGKVLMEFKFPSVKQISSVAFGGPNLDILFVTTASKDGDKSPDAGHLYKITGLDSVGCPGVKVKV